MQQAPIDSPFGHSSTATDVAEGIDLTGKNAMVTGASSGIGVETARALATAGASVWMPVRNREKGEAVAMDIRGSSGNDRVEVLDMDLAKPASVRAGAASLLRRARP